GDDFGDHLSVERLRGAGARRINTADHFGNLREAVLFVARIFAFGRECEKEIGGDVVAFNARGDGAAKPGFFENGKYKLFGSAGIGCGFENDELSLLQIGLDGDGGLFDEAEVGVAPFVERRGHADEDGVDLLEALEIRGGVEVTAVYELLNLVLADMIDVGLPGVEHGDFGRIGVKTGDSVARFGKTKGEGKSY